MDNGGYPFWWNDFHKSAFSRKICEDYISGSALALLYWFDQHFKMVDAYTNNAKIISYLKHSLEVLSYLNVVWAPNALLAYVDLFPKVVNLSPPPPPLFFNVIIIVIHSAYFIMLDLFLEYGKKKIAVGRHVRLVYYPARSHAEL